MAGAVDRLLASPAYGERWAALWLDLARFSDTMGYEKDPARTIWPFRDWVIRAFNADLPFDQFTLKQLAGDLLENPEIAHDEYYRNNPPGISDSLRRRTLHALDELNQKTAAEIGDPETTTRIGQYEMACRMQVHASDAFDIHKEPKAMHEMYGTEPGRESFANNCMLARRLAERGVRYIQLFDWGWDHHGSGACEDLRQGFVSKCRGLDRPVSALLKDLKQRGLLDDTLVVWSGEFGRTPMRENRRGAVSPFAGRDQNPGAYTMWLAGAGVKRGFSYGETDPSGYRVLIDKVSAHDLHATLLHLLGFDHQRFTFPRQGADQRLSNITKSARVVSEILA